MKDYKSLIADIRTEACELADKQKRLEVFMMSEDFCKISPEQKGLLEQQYDLMAKYKVILVKRAHRINYEHSIQTIKDNSVLDSEKTELACASCKWGGKYHENGELVYSCHNKDAKAIRDHKCYAPKEPEKAPALTFDTNPEICEKCTHHTKSWSTCHDCVKGSNFTDLKIINCAACVHYKEESCTHKVLDGDDSCFEKRLEPHEFSALEYEAHLKAKGDKVCSDCYYFKDMPNGPRCKMCDNGSCWEKRERH